MDTTTATTTANTQILDSMHMDYVHHIAFDMYGRRMATCSGDGRVRIWDLDSSGNWKLGGTPWQAHKSSISQLQWAHPEFGPLLATCGSDHDAKIWEEREQPTTTTAETSRWVEKAKLTEARRAVTCLAFAPRQLGLLLATGSSDGSVRVYEAVDLMNLAQWPIQATIGEEQTNDSNETLGVTCLSWGTGRFEPPTLVVGGGSSLVVYRYTNKTWNAILALPSSSIGHVLDVAWAPNVGRRYHLIAAAYQNEMVVYKLSRKDTPHLVLESSQSLSATMFKCQWNVTGTVLASSGDGGAVQLWKSDFDGNWKCVSKIYGDLNETEK